MFARLLFLNLENTMWNIGEHLFATLPSWLQSLLLLFFPLFDLHSRLAWFYVLGFFGIAMCSYWLSRGNPSDRSWGNFWDYTFPKSLYTSHSASLDWQCYAINGLLKIAINLAGLSIAASSAMVCQQVLESTFGVTDFQIESSLLLVLGHAFFSVAIYDFGTFLVHYWLHKVPLLWEFHKVHHIAEGLTPITGFRDHPIEVAFKNPIRTLFLGIYLGGFNYMTNNHIETLTIGGTLIFIFLFDFTINFRHSHIWISYGWYLEHIFSSPAMHQIHHSQKETHIDKNFAVIFSFWDYLFGTIYIPTQREQLTVGIPGERDYKSIWQLYYQPCGRAWKILRNTPIAHRKIKLWDNR
ncbi:MAG: sterol desaturase family protein [Spirulina sp.]